MIINNENKKINTNGAYNGCSPQIKIEVKGTSHGTWADLKGNLYKLDIEHTEHKPKGEYLPHRIKFEFK